MPLKDSDGRTYATPADWMAEVERRSRERFPERYEKKEGTKSADQGQDESSLTHPREVEYEAHPGGAAPGDAQHGDPQPDDGQAAGGPEGRADEPAAREGQAPGGTAPERERRPVDPDADIPF